jgi:hypothetical protein
MSKKITRFNMKIDRQNVLTIPVEDNDGDWVMYKDIKELIEPSGSLHPVIRCRNCKHYNTKIQDCKNPKVRNSADADIYVIYPEYCTIDENFGCIHFEKCI